MTHVRAPHLAYHLYHSLIILKEKQASTIAGLVSVWWNVIDGFLCGLGGFLGFKWREGSRVARLAGGSSTSIT